MAASSSSSRLWSYDVFPSFSGEDVRNTFLSHCYKEFQRKGIKTFEDQKIQRGQTIAPELVQAIRESRISIVVLSQNYASSGWCLDELLEIMKCRDTGEQRVMTIFYGVDPSDVRKQTGDFGEAFKETCARKTEEVEEKKQRWRKALTDVGNIAGYHYVPRRDNEAKMIERIASDILKELNHSIVSRGFDDLIGIGTHLDKMSPLLCLESNEVRMVAIWGPAGIGKTTLARVICDRLSVSGNFRLICFMDDIGKTFRRPYFNLHRYKLDLQERFLSRILDIKDLQIHHLGVVKERLNHLKVLAVFDDVDKKEQLEALAARTEWFGAGSRIIVTTEDRSILDAYGNSYVYEMGFPSNDEAMQIFCQSAFEQSSPPDGFHDLAIEVVGLAGNLPLGLKVLGSSLQGMNKDEWEDALPRLRTNLNGEIEEVLRYSYDCLEKKDQAIFRHIACLFNHEKVDRVISLLDDSELNVGHGLNILAKKCLIQIHEDRVIVMNKLLERVGREIVHNQSINKPRKREFLVDRKDIEDVLTQNTDKEITCLGISLHIEDWNYKMSINERAFERMTNLQFLRISQPPFLGKPNVQLPQGLSYLPPKLRLLHWDMYPLKSLPPDFCPKHLVQLSMRWSNLERLWKGTKLLGRLKRMDLRESKNLKKIPDLLETKNLKTLKLGSCLGSVELPSIGHLSKLTTLDLFSWKSLEVLPANINLKSLNRLNCGRCSKLRCFPEISQNLERLDLSMTAIEEVPSSVALWSRLTKLDMFYCENLKTFPHVPSCIERIILMGSGIEEVPSRIKNLFWLCALNMSCCKKLTNVSSNIFRLENLKTLDFSGCENLERFSPPLESPEIPCEKVSAALDEASHEFESSRILFFFHGKRHTLDLSHCKKLLELPKLPVWVLILRANNCESLERISHPFNKDLKIQLSFSNCFKLNEEAQKLIQDTVCRYALLPGTKLPPYITHRSSGSSLTISSDKIPVSGFFETKPYLLLAAILNPGWKWNKSKIKCHVNGQHGSVGFQREWLIPIHSTDDIMPDEDVQSEHLIIFRIFDWPKEDDVPRDELSHDERVLEFTCVPPKDSQVREFGVYQLLDSAYVCEKEESSTDTFEGTQYESNKLPSDIDIHGGYQSESDNVTSDSDMEVSSNRKRRRISPREKLESDEQK